MNHAKSVVLFMVGIGVFAVATVLLIIISELQLVTYKSSDMEPTISQNGSIVISKRRATIRRGDIIIHKYPADHSQLFIKRVIGLPGEVIAIREGRIFIDGKLLEENYLDRKLTNIARILSEYQIPQRSYYLLGDNREASNDSRNWGPLSEDLIYGKILFKK